MRKKFKRFSSIVISLTAAIAMTVTLAPAAFAAEAGLPENVSEAVVSPEQARADGVAAFPGAEGGGKYTTGGRGGEVYHVTNLNDDGPGSLRDGISKPNRTIVFDVSGTIHLNSDLRMEQPNITIAGQTAPGDGICIGNYNLMIYTDNVIVRYIRVRPGDVSQAENDAIFARYYKDIIIDHCSTSWSTDETMSLYGVANTTVQWCYITESLTLAQHAKGRHGYGGIWGGYNTTYHHNLVATHTSRLPRYHGVKDSHPDYKIGDNDALSSNDMVNNVIYNWGFNNSYGGGGVTLNFVNNYYKSGPITNKDVLDRIWNPDNTTMYVSGNVLEGNDEVTKDNMKGIEWGEDSNPVFLDEPTYENELIPLDNTDTAQEAYEKVLASAGATLPKRDSYDARITNDVKNGTGRSINSEAEVGGWPELKSEEPKADGDRDGIPDEYETQNGLDKDDPADGAAITESGYSNLELYLNSIVENASAPKNPDAELNMENNSIYNYGEPIELSANASAKEGRSIAEVRFFANEKLLYSDTEAPYEYTYTDAPEGASYMSACAVDSAGEATTSDIKVINVNYTDSPGDWQTMDIGEATMPGSYSLRDGVYTVKSSGLIGAGNEFNEMDGDEGTDAFSYMYKEADTNSVLTAKLESVSRLNNNCLSGLMFRDELTPTSDFVMVNYQIEKGGSGLSFLYRTDGKMTKKFIVLSELPRYMKLVKIGDTFTAYHSINGIDWEYFDSVDLSFEGTNYGGVGQDGNKETNQISTYAWGKYTDLSLDNYGENKIPDIEMRTGVMGEQDGINQSIFNWQDKSQFGVGDSVNLKISSSELESASKIEIYLDGVLNQTIDAPKEIENVTINEPGNHYITAVIYDADGAKNSATQNVGVSAVGGDWKVSEIHYPKDIQANGTTIRHGAFELDGTNLKITGTGYGIEGVENEEYPMMYRQLSGDFEASFKVDEQDLADYDHMGFVVKNSLDPQEDGTSYAAYYEIYYGQMFRKTAEYGKTYELIGQQKYKQLPAWIRLKKTGKTLKMDYSQNGIDWIDVGEEQNCNLNDTYYLGVFGASNEEFKISDFSLSEFVVNTDSSGIDDYVDLGGYEWAEPAIKDLTARGIVNGDISPATFERYFFPDINVTRAEFAKMVSVASGAKLSETETEHIFSDVDDLAWYAPYVYTAYANGLVQGTGKNTFEPDKPITREEMAVMMSRLPENGDSAAEPPEELPFADGAEISDWAQRGVAFCLEKGIMQGDENNSFNPGDFAIRAEAAQVIYNFVTK